MRVRRQKVVWQVEGGWDNWQPLDPAAATRSPTFRFPCDRVATIMAQLP